MSAMPNARQDNYELRIVTLEGERVGAPGGYRFGTNNVCYDRHLPDCFALDLLKNYLHKELFGRMQDLVNTGHRITQLNLERKDG